MSDDDEMPCPGPRPVDLAEMRRLATCDGDAQISNILRYAADEIVWLRCQLAAVQDDLRNNSVSAIREVVLAERREIERLRSTLREAIAALDVAAIALNAAGDKIAASVAAAAIGNARKELGDE